MMLLTKAIRNKLPKLYSQENTPDPTVRVKFFTPWTNWTWYATEGEAVLDENGREVDFRFFGKVHGFEKEWGYFMLNELQTARGPLGLNIERDKWFTPGPISEVEGT